MSETWKNFLSLEEKLCSQLLEINFLERSSTVSYVYNPIEYAMKPHLEFLTRFSSSPKEILFVGMNPGPYGMAQTGVPFGDVDTVRDWLRIKNDVSLPLTIATHPSKPVLGLKCQRIEVSGARFWGFFRKKLNLSPDQFFKHCFVLNVCPLLFLDKKGKNVALSNLIAPIRRQVESLCDNFLADVIAQLQPEIILGVGQYATNRIQKVMKQMKSNAQCDLHISYENKTRYILLQQDEPRSQKTSTPSFLSSESHAPESKPVLSHNSEDSKMEIQNNFTFTNVKIENIRKNEDMESNTTHVHREGSSRAVESSQEQTHMSPIRHPRIYTLMHPSPANPAANKGWDNIAMRQLQEFGVLDYFERSVKKGKFQHSSSP